MALLLLIKKVLLPRTTHFTGLEFFAIFSFKACPDTKEFAVQKEEKLIGCPSHLGWVSVRETCFGEGILLIPAMAQ